MLSPNRVLFFWGMIWFHPFDVIQQGAALGVLGVQNKSAKKEVSETHGALCGIFPINGVAITSPVYLVAGAQ